MKKKINQVEYSCKGELVQFMDDNIIMVELTKKDDVIEDEISFSDIVNDMREFYEMNQGKNVEILFRAKATLE